MAGRHYQRGKPVRILHGGILAFLKQHLDRGRVICRGSLDKGSAVHFVTGSRQVRAFFE